MNKTFKFNRKGWRPLENDFRFEGEDDGGDSKVTIEGVEFTPEQQKAIDTFIGHRISGIQLKASEATKKIEELSQKTEKTEKEKAELQKALTDLKEANMSVDEKAKEDSMREVNKYKGEAEVQTKLATKYQSEFETLVMTDALRKHAQANGFKPKAIDHFLSWAMTRAKVEPVEGTDTYKISVDVMQDVNGVQTPSVMTDKEFVEHCAKSDEWAYAVDTPRKGGLGGKAPFTGNTEDASKLPANDRVGAALTKEGLIK